MKGRVLALLFIAVALIAAVSLNQPAAAQEIISENLFQNPGWEAGYYNQDNIPQIAVPNGWRMHWLDNVPFEGTNGLPAYRPETVVWNIQDAPENERSLFFRDGVYTFKVFKGHAPMYAALSQDVNGLEVGRKYRIMAPIFVDIVADYEGGKKVPPWDGSHGFVRFGAGPAGAPWLDTSQITYSPYWTAENVNPFYLTMPIFVWDFVANSPNMTIFLEMGSKYPHRNNGFFMDGVGLFALNEKDGSVTAPPGSGGGSGGGGGAPAAPAPTAVPVEVTPREDGSIVHVVASGDSFWTIAIRYAPTLDMAPEAALSQIQELNGNPQFINLGEELLIREPGNYGDTPAGSEPVAEEAPETEEAAGEAPAETEETEAEAETEAEGSPDGRTETGEEVITVEGQPLETEGEAEAAATPAPARLSGICVGAFSDSNGNGTFDGAPETLKADAAITLFKDGSTVTTHITDGVTDSHCFDNLEPGTYQVQLYPPANYVPTTADSWAVSVVEGVYIPLEFGMLYQPGGAEEVADASAAGVVEVSNSGDTAVADAPAESQAADTAAPDDAAANGDGLLANIGLIVVIIAVVLVLIAGAGVVMLRRG